MFINLCLIAVIAIIVIIASVSYQLSKFNDKIDIKLSKFTVNYTYELSRYEEKYEFILGKINKIDTDVIKLLSTSININKSINDRNDAIITQYEEIIKRLIELSKVNTIIRDTVNETVMKNDFSNVISNLIDTIDGKNHKTIDRIAEVIDNDVDDVIKKIEAKNSSINRLIKNYTITPKDEQ